MRSVHLRIRRAGVAAARLVVLGLLAAACSRQHDRSGRKAHPDDGGPVDSAGPSSTDSEAPTLPGDSGVPTTTPTTEPPPARLVLRSGRPPRNLLMISIDTLRADALDRLGGSGRTPFLSRMANEGFSVDDTRACAHYTLPTTACAIGGRSSVDLYAETGVLLQSWFPGAPGTFGAETPFLQTWLRQIGFRTMLVSGNGAFGGADIGGHADDFDYVWVQHETVGEEVVAAAMNAVWDWRLRGYLEEPWYLQVHLYDPHRLYSPPEDYLDEVRKLEPIPYDLDTLEGHYNAMADVTKGKLDPAMDALVREHFHLRYQAELEHVDDVVESLWSQLEALGLLEDTLAVFWADHGEQFFEHGHLGHGKGLYEEENRIMWFFWAKDLEPGFTTRPAMNIDLVPTLLDLYSIPRPAMVTGKALAELEPTRTRLGFGISTTGPIASALRPPWLIHWGFSDPEYIDGVMLETMLGRHAYDLSTDPGAQRPVWPDDPALKSLWSELSAEVRRAEPGIEGLGFRVAWPDDG